MIKPDPESVRGRLCAQIAAARERKATRCDEMAAEHVNGRAHAALRREATFWRDAAEIAREGDLTPLSFEDAGDA